MATAPNSLKQLDAITRRVDALTKKFRQAHDRFLATSHARGAQLDRRIKTVAKAAARADAALKSREKKNVDLLDRIILKFLGKEKEQ